MLTLSSRSIARISWAEAAVVPGAGAESAEGVIRVAAVTVAAGVAEAAALAIHLTEDLRNL